MGRVAAIGADLAVRGFALAGALVLPADDAQQARAAWRALPADVELVILTPAASAALAGTLPEAGPILVAVLPDDG